MTPCLLQTARHVAPIHGRRCAAACTGSGKSVPRLLLCSLQGAANLAQLVCIAGGKHDLIGRLGGDVHDALLVDNRQDALDVPDVALARDQRLPALPSSCLCPYTCCYSQLAILS